MYVTMVMKFEKTGILIRIGEDFFSCHAHTFSHGRYTQVLLGRLESKLGDIRFGLPDADVINIFRIEKVGE